MGLLILLVILLLLFGGGGVWTARPGYTGWAGAPSLLWLLAAVVLIVLVLRLLGVWV